MRLPLPGSPSSSWDAYAAHLSALRKHPSMKVVVAFWLFGRLTFLARRIHFRDS